MEKNAGTNGLSHQIESQDNQLSKDKILVNTYKNILLGNLAKDYKIKLDDPEGKEKDYNYMDRKTNANVVELDKSITRAAALLMFMKRKKYLNDLLKEQGIEYFEKMRKENLSEKGYKFCKDMYEKYDIIPIADPKILDYFSRVIGTVYNGNSLGKFSIVRSWSSVENRSGRIKHEGIHSRQGGTKKWIKSLNSMIKRRGEVSGLVPWATDYATDNQNSDRQTYINQYKEDPIKDIKPYEFEKYKEKKNRFDAIRDHMQIDIDEMKQYIEELKQKISDVKEGKITLETQSDTSFTKDERLRNLTYILEVKEHDLKTMEKLQTEHYNTEDWHQFITFGEQDGYIYQETPEKRQTNFQSEDSFRKHVAIDMFITHYGDKKDNYKAGVEVYSKYRDKVLAIADEYTKTKDKKVLKQQMHALYKQIA